jgi:hypothetical protein
MLPKLFPITYVTLKMAERKKKKHGSSKKPVGFFFGIATTLLIAVGN